MKNDNNNNDDDTRDNTHDNAHDNTDEKKDTRMNKCNLELLTNPLYQKCILKTEKKERVKNCKTDLKFYRKRILSLTNDYLKGNYTPYGGSVNETLKQLHDEYVYNVIQYLKMTDKVDIIQQEHKVDIIQQEHKVDIGISPRTSTPTPNPTPTSSDNYDKQPIINPLDSYNSQLIIKQVNTLDSYIKKTKRVVKKPIKLPVNRVIDYHLPELKTKGVKEK